MKTINLFKISLFAIILFSTSCSTSDDTINSVNTGTNAISLKCNINEDLILTNHIEGVDYIVDCDVKVNALLKIEEGTTIIFKTSSSILIDTSGALKAIGSSINPITFMGEEDIKGYWKGISFYSDDVRNELNHTIIKNAGSSRVSAFGDDIASVGVVSSSEDGKLIFKNSIIEKGNGYGLSVEKDAVLNELDNVNIIDVEHSAIICNANHVYKINANTVFSQNGFDGIELRRSFLRTNANHIWAGFSYKITGDIDIEKDLKINSGAHLSFEPSTTFNILNPGSLQALGTASNRITFTGTYTQSPSWKGIAFESSSVLNRLEYCDVSFGGSDEVSVWADGFKANIALVDGYSSNNGRAIIYNCNISNSGGNGIFVGTNCNLTQNNNLFTNLMGQNIAYQ